MSWIRAAMLPENVIRRHLRAIRLILSAALIVVVLAVIARLDWAAVRAVTHEVGVVSIDDEFYVARLRVVHHAGGACSVSTVNIVRQWAVDFADNPSPSRRGLPWTLAEVDAPHRARFRRTSGALTGSLRVDWRPPNAVQRSVIRWAPDGRSVEFATDRRSPYRRLGARFHAGRVLVAFLRELFVTAAIAAPPVGIIWWLTSDRHWVSMRPTECPQCGYDLRGCKQRGCPECGWGRSDEDAAT